MCHQGRIDQQLMVLVILKEGDDIRHVQRYMYMYSSLAVTCHSYSWMKVINNNIIF